LKNVMRDRHLKYMYDCLIFKNLNYALFNSKKMLFNLICYIQRIS